MSDYTPTENYVRQAFISEYLHDRGLDGSKTSNAAAQAAWHRWLDTKLAEVRPQVAVETLTAMADELDSLDDGGKRGLQGHSKSSASAITHRHAVDVVRARAQAHREPKDGNS